MDMQYVDSISATQDQIQLVIIIIISIVIIIMIILFMPAVANVSHTIFTTK